MQWCRGGKLFYSVLLQNAKKRKLEDGGGEDMGKYIHIG